MVGPLSAVLAAIQNHAGTLADIVRVTGLPRDVVDASVAHLVRLGRLDARELAMGCPSGGCGTCASGVDGTPGCGSSAPSRARTGPVLVALSLRRPDAAHGGSAALESSGDLD